MFPSYRKSDTEGLEVRGICPSDERNSIAFGIAKKQGERAPKVEIE